MDQSLLSYLEEESLAILFIRHGQMSHKDGEVIPKGLKGNPLSREGIQQAKLLAKRLEVVPLVHIYTSRMTRAYQTAQEVSALHPKVPFEARPDLYEAAGFHVPGGPVACTPTMRQRLHKEREEAQKFFGLLKKRHQPGQVIAVVAHGTRNRLLLATCMGMPSRKFPHMWPYNTNISMINIRPKPEGSTLVLLNCTRHLPKNLIGVGLK